MPNGTLAEFIEKNPGAKRIGLVRLSPQSHLTHNVTPPQAIGCRRRSQFSSHEQHHTRKLERGRYFFRVTLSLTDDLCCLAQRSRRSRRPGSFDGFRVSFYCPWNDHTGSGRVCVWHDCDRGQSVCLATSNFRDGGVVGPSDI